MDRHLHPPLVDLIPPYFDAMRRTLELQKIKAAEKIPEPVEPTPPAVAIYDAIPMISFKTQSVEVYANKFNFFETQLYRSVDDLIAGNKNFNENLGTPIFEARDLRFVRYGSRVSVDDLKLTLRFFIHTTRPDWVAGRFTEALYQCLADFYPDLVISRSQDRIVFKPDMYFS